jgi:TolB-like protein/Tfp pilus assembly protein PilF
MQSGTRELTKPRSRKVVVAVSMVVGVVIAAAIIVGYFYFTRNRTAAIQSIAVMPFVNASGNADVEYLSDGITESLINSLSQLPNLSVKARSTVFHYKGKDVTPQRVGLELSVQAVLNGRVAQRGDQLTLSLELVDARTGNQIWGEQYNRKQTDLVSLQNEIARDVSDKLRVKLSGADQQRLAKNYTADPEAYRLYLLGRFHWNKRTLPDFRKAIDYFKQAIIADPNYALAYAGLADAYMLNSEYGGEPPREAIPKARETAQKALSLDEQLSEAHTALGVIFFNDYDFSGAEREYKRAIELDPNNATAHQWYGLFLVEVVGKFEDGLIEVERALEIEPFSPAINRSKGDVLFYARRYDESIAQLNKTIALDPNWAPPHRVLSFNYWAKGEYEASVNEFAKNREVQGRSGAAQIRESFSRGGWTGFLRWRIDDNRDRTGSGFTSALCYAALGDKDKALIALNRAYEDHENAVLLLKVHPLVDPLRSDPRFADLMRRMGLQQ